MHAEYLIFNLIILVSPFCLKVFFKKGSLPDLRVAAISITGAAVPFIIWDVVVTNWFWVFNEAYTLGINSGKVPIEELMFFFTVPTACLILWQNLGKSRAVPLEPQFFKKYVMTAASLMLFVSVYLYLEGLYYSGTVLVFFAAIILLDLYFQTRVLLDIRTWRLLGLVIIFTTVFNGYLTARPVVLYDQVLLSKLYIWTIPVEDYVFGVGLILLNLVLYQLVERNTLKIGH